MSNSADQQQLRPLHHDESNQAIRRNIPWAGLGYPSFGAWVQKNTTGLVAFTTFFLLFLVIPNDTIPIRSALAERMRVLGVLSRFSTLRLGDGRVRVAPSLLFLACLELRGNVSVSYYSLS